MSLQIIHGNVLDVHSDAVLLPIDGAAEGMEGNLAHQFAKRWPEVWEEGAQEIPCPLSLGNVVVVEPENACNFSFIIVA